MLILEIKINIWALKISARYISIFFVEIKKRRRKECKKGKLKFED